VREKQETKTMINVYYACLLDEENCPEITTASRKRALELAQQKTSNPVSVAEFEKGEYLVFYEKISVDETLPENRGYTIEAMINDLTPQCSDAEYSSHRKVKVTPQKC
jgi:hypothetical protein